MPGDEIGEMSIVTKDSCSRITPALLPFVEQCLASEELNAQGGVLEIKRPKARYNIYNVYTYLYL